MARYLGHGAFDDDRDRAAEQEAYNKAYEAAQAVFEKAKKRSIQFRRTGTRQYQANFEGSKIEVKVTYFTAKRKIWVDDMYVGKFAAQPSSWTLSF
jgi:hypothetical protein